MRLPATVTSRHETQLAKELRDLREEVRSLVVLGMRPDLLPDEVEFIQNLERSARAEIKSLLKTCDSESAARL